MHHSVNSGLAAAPAMGFWRGTFAAKMDHAVQRGAKTPCLLQPATAEEIGHWLSHVGKILRLASLDGVWRMTAKNPDIIRTIRFTPDGLPLGVFAYLPLNAFGAHAITNGEFDGASPDPAWICCAGEQPEAFYWWLIYSPGKLSRVLGAVARLFRELAPEGVPIFSRGATQESERLQLSVGFIKARDIYPCAPDWLLVALPEGTATRAAIMPHPAPIKVELIRTMAGLSQVFSVRSATYIAEQFCTYDEEFDGNDLCSTHFLGFVNGDAAGAIRLRWFGEFAKLERLCVRKEYRGKGLKEKLIQTALAHARMKRFTRVYGHARADLVRMWQRFGFEPIKDRPPFRFANVDYIEILCELELDPAGIRLGVPPMMLTRPEGAWDEPGPLDLSNVDPDPARLELIARHAQFRREET